MEKIDYNSLDGVPHTKTLAYLNNFVINTTQFLNRFSYLCEQKLATVSTHVQRLEITMSILEAKLQSIEGLGAAPVSSASSAAPPQASVAPSSSQPAATPAAVPAATAAPEPAAVSNVLLNKDAPQYSNYFKMLRLGIPLPQIKMKMKNDGVDPDVLNAPDAPVDAAAKTVASHPEDHASGDAESWESD